jgi:hypothetical protein
VVMVVVKVIFEPLQKLNARLDTAQSNQTRLDVRNPRRSFLQLAHAPRLTSWLYW